MKNIRLSLRKYSIYFVVVVVLSSCGVAKKRKQHDVYCEALNYFLEQDARLRILKRTDSERIYFYSNHYESIVRCFDQKADVVFVMAKSQLPNNGIHSYQLILSSLNMVNLGDGVLMTFLHLGEGNSYEVIIQMEDSSPRILDVREFQFDKSQVE
jgi:hypothetical protein